ncbi:MAG TPA: hypothetical protein PKJ19_05775 [Flavobacteriales bacterium]|nr:hypothetical protein [Flavobacteriales bacterium]HNU55967.1 hypothetical protein [Flavobacteriales bacterium]
MVRNLVTVLLLLAATTASAQKAIWSHAVGNWRNGPVVYITPLIETTEAVTTPQLLADYRLFFPELRDVVDLDVLRFATPEEGNDSRKVLKAKYDMRKLEVVMLELPVIEDRKAE